MNGGRVECVTDAGKESLYWNIPIANTTTVLRGTGTSVTQAAVRELARAGVMLGFCGGGGTSLFALNPQHPSQLARRRQAGTGYGAQSGIWPGPD